MRGNFWKIDLGLVIPVLVLLILSLTALSSINAGFFRNQLIFIVIGILAFTFFSQVNYKVVQLYATPIYIISVVLLILVLILGIESHGAIRWIEVVGFRVQFSEILKPFLAISLSSFLATRKNYSFTSLVLGLGLLLVVSLLIFFQPDLGSALIYVLVTILTLIFFGFPFKYFVGGLGFLAISTPLIWRFLRDYQKERILTFLNPTHDPLGGSYNAIQSIIAVGSGMFFGKGLGQGTQSQLFFLPERHTDFIFATISEQLGFIGSILIIFCFGFILYRIFKIFASCEDSFSKTFIAVSFFIILVQFFINIGMNIGLLPVVGVTLPFVSYGGSSLLSNFILFGLIASITKGTKDPDILEIK